MKLNAVKAAAAKKASRRIVMRQVSVGSSNEPHPSLGFRSRD